MRLGITMLFGPAIAAHAQARDGSLLNVSYDPAREPQRQIDAAFAADWKAKGWPAVGFRFGPAAR